MPDHQPQNFIVELITDMDRFLNLKQDWDRLQQNQSFNTFFQTFEFHRIWWDSFGRKHNLHIITVSDNDQIRTIVPLMRTGKRLEFIGAPNSDYHDIIGNNDSNTINAILAHLRTTQKDWDEISFVQISSRSTTGQILCDALPDSGLPWLVREVDQCMVFEYVGDEENRSKFAVHKGRTHKKAANHYNRLGGYELRVVTDPLEANQLLELIFHLHITRWKGSPTPSKFENTEHRQFYRQLVDELRLEKDLLLIVQTVAKVPVAASVNFHLNWMMFCYTLAYSEFFRKRSPGTFFVTGQTELVIRRSHSLDFSRGSQDYKQALSNAKYANLEICIYSSKVTALAHRLYERLKKTSPIIKLGHNRKFQYYRDSLRNLISKRGIIGGLFSVFGNDKDDSPTISPTLYERTSAAKVEPSSDGEYSFHEIKREDSLALAVLLGIVNESPAYERLMENFADGDRYFLARDDIVPVACCRMTRADNFIETADSPAKPETLLCDLCVAEAFDETKVLPNLIVYTTNTTGANYLAEIAPSPERTESIQASGFKPLQ